MVLKLSNNATSLLAGAITDTATALDITSGDEGEFPTLGAGDWHPLTVYDAAGNMEIMKVTARAGVSMTVLRGQEGTTAKAFASGARCDIRPTAACVGNMFKADNLGGLTDKAAARENLGVTIGSDVQAYSADLEAYSTRIAGMFQAAPTSPASMKVNLAAGHIFKDASLTEVAAQQTADFVAPALNSRIDRIVIDRSSGTLSVVAGTAGAAPVAPAIPSGKHPVARIPLTAGQTSITADNIIDERDLFGLGLPSIIYGLLASGSIDSAETTDLGSLLARHITITGDVTITAFGASAYQGDIKEVTFSGAPLITHNAASLILPVAANYQAAAGDTLRAKYLGGGNWKVLSISPASGKSIAARTASTAAAGEVQLVGSGVDTALMDATSALTAAALAPLFTSSKATSGYQKLAGGLIIQWGTSTGGGTITFPVTFPTALVAILSTYNASIGDNQNPLGISARSTSGFTSQSYDQSSTAIYWLAIGY